ncbi:MAG: hypothetical protein ABUT20_42290 [Bacteroidota bacterium]
MKLKPILLLYFFAFGFAELKAQYVTIPDANFAFWLNQNIPTAMNGSLMDTSNVGITGRLTVKLRNKNISSLEGIQYFKALVHLDCDSNLLINLPSL